VIAAAHLGHPVIAAAQLGHPVIAAAQLGRRAHPRHSAVPAAPR
jgi:DUF917 family protein